MTYEAVREFAGSWMLLFMFVFFCGAVLWALRPGSSKQHRDSANLIFRNEKAPAPDAEESRKEART
ncbi:cbb3-type cytochrome c oxidase subunit 3 [Rhodovulum sp. 12E13]|jgi:cytochrome c oxidase cbb3-type subunit 4|uniref:cbb3-type cytochrome c oxidase subunit 3 n=1 Tax=Rhodovulum sp. 12E13 TaxID=2203891 RepID=UPI000E15C261|nr:cbb3-type cytochrome c oxidase subunit 3 [Rhodovulum sp. 12E13]RDC72834.1 cbb3-type cytochrome c oxidase subunit 3 [Rhodovulum sp. 12E13]